MPLVIRRAEIADLEVIQELNKELFEWDRQRDPDMNFDWPYQEVGKSYFTRRISESGACFVAVEHDQVVGYLAGGLRAEEKWRTKSRSEVENMFVKPSCRRSGAGSALMKVFFAWSKQQGAEQVLVEAFSGNDSALAFYKSNNFQPLAVSLQADL